MKALYLVRHCQAEGQSREAPLTEKGRQQADALAEFLGYHPIDHVVASPYQRAVDSVVPLGNRMQIPIHTDERLVERRLSANPLPDWLERLEESFRDERVSFEGGESGGAAKARGVEVLEQLMSSQFGNPLVVSHGNLLTLMLNHFDSNIGFNEWQSMTNPDVYVVRFSGEQSYIERIWQE